MSILPSDLLRHILDETDYINREISSLSQDEFIKNETLKRACVRSLEIIGEASKKLSSDFKENNPQIEWKLMAGMRDKLIHDYFGTDYEIVWDVIQNKLPVISDKIRKLLKI